MAQARGGILHNCLGSCKTQCLPPIPGTTPLFQKAWIKKQKKKGIWLIPLENSNKNKETHMGFHIQTCAGPMENAKFHIGSGPNILRRTDLLDHSKGPFSPPSGTAQCL